MVNSIDINIPQLKYNDAQLAKHMQTQYECDTYHGSSHETDSGIEYRHIGHHRGVTFK
jgi:hypothetical protein